MYHSIILLVVLSVAVLPLLVIGQMNYTCLPLPTRKVAASVLALHPTDVKIMMAMGDSITTGFGIQAATNESRGYSFSIGGSSETITLPNLFRFFNPQVVGLSTAYYSSDVCYGAGCAPSQFFPELDQNNAAKSGAMVFDVVSLQINYLIRQINKAPNMDVQNDWKVLTIMIGANDLCASCTFNLTYLSGDDYQNTLMGTLERIRTSLPRTFVNLVPLYNISQAYDLSKNITNCNNISRNLYIQCDCLFKPANSDVRATIDARIADFNSRAASVATYYQRKAYDNFAVVVQPFGLNTRLSSLPAKFLSMYDCFHPSYYGQQAMATALWNNMLTPKATKKNYIDVSDVPLCPTQDTLLYTY